MRPWSRRLALGLGLIACATLGSACQRVDWDDDGLTTTGAACDEAWATTLQSPRGQGSTSVLLDTLSVEREGDFLLGGTYRGWVKFDDITTFGDANERHSFLAAAGPDGAADWFVDLGDDLRLLSSHRVPGGVLAVASTRGPLNFDFAQVAAIGSTVPVLIHFDDAGNGQSVDVLDADVLGVELQPVASTLKPAGWLVGRRTELLGDPLDPDQVSIVELVRLNPLGTVGARATIAGLDSGSVTVVSLAGSPDGGALLVIDPRGPVRVGEQVYGDFDTDDHILVSFDTSGQVRWSVRIERAAGSLGAGSGWKTHVVSDDNADAFIAFSSSGAARVGATNVTLGVGLSTIIARISGGVLTQYLVLEADNSLSSIEPRALALRPDRGVLVTGVLAGEVHLGEVPATSLPPLTNSWLVAMDPAGEIEWVQLGNRRDTSTVESLLTATQVAAVGAGAMQAGTLRGAARFDDAELNVGAGDGAYVVRVSPQGVVACE